MTAHGALLADLAGAERADGWMAACADAGRYLALSEELVAALARELGAPGAGPVVEVCAGDGALAAALGERGVPLVATDAAPPARAAGRVERLTAAEALERYRPRVVLGSFVPADAGVDARVLGSASVGAYVVLGARLWDGFGSRALWAAAGGRAGWRAEPLPAVARWMVTRHDAWLGDGVPPLCRGEAWRFTRAPR